VIRPAAQDEVFLAALAQPPALGALRLWWLGQSGFLVEHNGARLLFDPYLSESLTTKYADSDKPHVRMIERVVAPDKLTGIDVVTSSHNHTDHLDAETLFPLRGANPGMRFIIPEANRAFIANRLGGDLSDAIGLDDGMSVEVGNFRIHGIASAHNELERDAHGRYVYLGYVVQCGDWTIYHSGDTLLYAGLAEKLRRFRIEIALLPINGNRPERRVAGNLDGREAAWLAKEMGAGVVVPHHYEMFEFNTADPRELFIPECERLGQAFQVLRVGTALTLPAL
jgi:L-ascorbate metabolism protein UlaG (beta-lactamase superfamily)